MDIDFRRINKTNSSGNSVLNNNSRLRNSLDTTIPGLFSSKYSERILSFSYEDSVSLGSSNLSDKLSQIFSDNSNEPNIKRSYSTGKSKFIYLNIYFIFIFIF